jgi:hypothetical protein
MKMIVFWDVTPNSLVEGTYYIHLQGYRMFLVGYITMVGAIGLMEVVFPKFSERTVDDKGPQAGQLVSKLRSSSETSVNCYQITGGHITEDNEVRSLSLLIKLKSLRLTIKHYAMKSYGGVGVYIHAFMTSALVGDE